MLKFHRYEREQFETLLEVPARPLIIWSKQLLAGQRDPHSQ